MVDMCPRHVGGRYSTPGSEERASQPLLFIPSRKPLGAACAPRPPDRAALPSPRRWIFLLYLYSSNLALPGEGSRLWRLAFATDGLITAGFFSRGLTMPAGPARTLFLRFGYFRTVSVVIDAFFVVGMHEPPPRSAALLADAIRATDHTCGQK